jgi:hypothetical protein
VDGTLRGGRSTYNEQNLSINIVLKDKKHVSGTFSHVCRCVMYVLTKLNPPATQAVDVVVIYLIRQRAQVKQPLPWGTALIE